ncbi:MAG TPA: hypothetical protein VH081_00800 [Solirubrobacteraceae bacterium]|nr:hypothetical protein [Solirubrobacteraceae bacterium]
MSNGLGSPLCRMAPGREALSSSSRRNCETSGFVASPAQTGDLGIDVHIDTGLLGLSSGGLLVTVQDLCVTPLWMALLWAVHALLVMLEWCFTLDLLDSASVQSGLARGLRQMQSAFTAPWLATVLAAAAVLAAYNGLVRRRVTETLGQTLLTLAMMAGGFWVMLDPTGTVGALGSWANQASLGTLAVTARGAPSGDGRTLADGIGALFAAAIEAPWCYLEFGDVGWCRDASRLDPRLRSAALAIASEEEARAGCETAKSPGSCAGQGEGDAGALRASASLLRSARTNGAIFLALPANGSARNAINDPSSLLRAICQSEDATSCRGSAATEAEFRTNRGTWPRVGGLLLIVAGVLGMLLLLGFIVLRLLTAALFSLLYLLLAPIAVLAPALGENGRAAFRRWSTQLLSAVVSKLLFSFLLGAVLFVLSILADLEALGWWTQWLLMSAFWWSAFARRHQALQLASASRTTGHPEPRALLRRVGNVVEPRRRLHEHRREARERRRLRRLDPVDHGRIARAEASSRRERPPRHGPPPNADQPPSARTAELGDTQARRAFDAERNAALTRLSEADELEQRAAALGARLERLRSAQADARAAGEVRRADSLAGRAERLQTELDGERDQTIAAARTADDASAAPPQGSDGAPGENAQARFLDAQAALPGSVEAYRAGAHERRDYVALAGLVGYGPREFRQLSAQERRVARVAIDRELSLRRSARPHAVVQRPGVQRPRGKAPQRPARGDHGGTGSPRRSTSQRARADSPESSVLRDVREVEAGRKRQLGYDQP